MPLAEESPSPDARYRWLVTLTLILATSAIFVQAVMHYDAGRSGMLLLPGGIALATWIVIGRVGPGTTIPSLNIGALKTVAPEHLAQASGAVNFFRQLGGAIGVNVLSILLEWLSSRSPQAGQTIRQVQDAAFSDCFLVLAAVFLLAIYPAWRTRE